MSSLLSYIKFDLLRRLRIYFITGMPERKKGHGKTANLENYDTRTWMKCANNMGMYLYI